MHESWDSPYRWRELRSQTKQESIDEDIDSHQTLSNINFIREPDEDLEALPSPAGSDDGKELKDSINEAMKMKEKRIDYIKQDQFKEKHIKFEDNQFKVNLRKVEGSSKYKNINENYTMNSAPANKDFDYIKAIPLKVKPKYSVDPIEELRNIARRDSNASDDEPPFNFQGMLRKTNFRRESLKNSVQAIRRYSLTKEHGKNIVNGLPNGHDDDNAINRKHCSLEIFPGLIMEGVEVEL